MILSTKQKLNLKFQQPIHVISPNPYGLQGQSVQEMVMMSTSILKIKWTIKGKPKSLVAAIGGDLIIKVDSQFTLNQISGQVIEHEESWDVSSSSAISQAFFWASRYLFASAEAGKDLGDSVSSLTGRVSTEKQNLEMFPDPSGDPTKVSVFFILLIVYLYQAKLLFPFSPMLF